MCMAGVGHLLDTEAVAQHHVRLLRSVLRLVRVRSEVRVRVGAGVRVRARGFEGSRVKGLDVKGQG